MIRINLLPPEERRTQLPLARIFLIITTGVIGFGIAVYTYGFFTIMNLENQLHDTRNQYELLKPTQEKMQSTTAIVQQIQAKNAVLIALTQDRKSWHAIMTHLGVLATTNVWLNEVSLAEKNLLKIKGMAGSYPDLAAFIKKLEQDAFFTDVLLLNAEKFNQDKNPSTSVANFELSVKIKGM